MKGSEESASRRCWPAEIPALLKEHRIVLEARLSPLRRALLLLDLLLLGGTIWVSVRERRR